MEVLEDSQAFSDIFESLAHLKNTKSELQMDSAPEFVELVNFVNNFLEIEDEQKAKAYINYLINDLKIFALLKLSNVNTKTEEQKDQNVFKKSERTDLKAK